MTTAVVCILGAAALGACSMPHGSSEAGSAEAAEQPANGRSPQVRVARKLNDSGRNHDDHTSRPEIDTPNIDPPLVIDGEEWSFRTAGPPPEERRIREDHPRLLFTRDSIPALKAKLSDPAYGSRARHGSYWWHVFHDAEKGDALANAFLYWMGFGEGYGERARSLALAGKFPDWHIGRLNNALTSALTYDWVTPLLTAEERRQLFERVKAAQGYDHTTKSKDPKSGWYFNDPWAGHTLNAGFHCWYALAGLAGYGDGVDDAWCRSVIDAAYDDNPWVMGPYGPDRGYGMLDVLNTMALDSGGSQAGSDGTPGSGYTSMFLAGAPVVLAAWETATGEPVLKKCNFLKLLPHWWAYEFDREGVVWPSRSTAEYLTGLYRDSAPDTAALMKHRLDTHRSYGSYQWLLRMILGDLRVKPRSPNELGLPRAAWLRGADVFVSRTSWDADATVLKVYCRYLDTNRYEQHSGTLSLRHKGRTLLAGGKFSKDSVACPQNHSGLWVWQEKPTEGHGSTYWNELNNLPARTRRARAAREVATDPIFRTGNPLRALTQSGIRLIEMDTTRLWRAAPVQLTQRTVAHLIGQDRQFLVIYDRTHVPRPLQRSWSLRLPTDPQIDGGRVFVTNGDARLIATAVLPETARWEWAGGEGREWIGPDGSGAKAGYADRWPQAGYSADPAAADRYGRGNLLLRASGEPESLDYLVVCEIGETGFVPAEITRDRKTVYVGDWILKVGVRLKVRRS